MIDVTDERLARGQALADAVAERDGLTATKLAQMASLTRPTYYAAVAGEAKPDTYEAFEKALAEWDENPDDRASFPEEVVVTPRGDGLIEVELGGVSNARFNAERVIIRGPVENVDDLVDAVQKILMRVTDDTED
jgi:hypothetical protein